jgi:hypothetical protein
VGGTVITVDSPIPVPGAVAVTADALSGALAAAVDPDLLIAPRTPDIGFVHRRCRDADVYLLANTGPRTRAFRITGRGSVAGCAEWDPASGQVRRADLAGDGHLITLHPHQATVIVMSDREVAGPDGPAPVEPSRWLRLDGPWQVAFAAEPPQPVRLPHVWEEQPGRRHFSGAAVYTSTFDLDGLADQDRVLLDFGDVRAAEAAPPGQAGRSFRASVRAPVGELAEVRLNGVACGIAWAPPYRVDLSAAACDGRNDIEITVRNTAANALAGDEEIGRLAAESEARYGRRFRMQDLDRAMSTVRSGLLRVPMIGIAAAADSP